MHEARTRPGGRIVWVRDATANDSDKSFTVPAGKMWQLSYVESLLITTATVGNRYFTTTVSDGTNVLYTSPQFNLAATQSGWFLLVAESGIYSVSRAKGSNAGYSDALGFLYLPAGYVIRVYDANTVDAAADDLTVVLHYIEYDA